MSVISLTNAVIIVCIECGIHFSLYSFTSSTFILPSVIVPVLSKHKVSMCANVSTLYKSWTNTRFLASFITPVAKDIVIRSISPFGNIPNKAAAVETTEFVISTFLKKYACTNNIIPTGIITKLVKFVTFFIEFTSSDSALLYFLVSLVICAAKLSFPTFSTLE